MLTALWSAKTIPVNAAEITATGSERTPMVSTSRMTRRKYEGGRARFLSTRAASSPRPPYHMMLRVSALSMASFRPKAVHESGEVGALGLERGRGRDVQEVVEAALVLHREALDPHPRRRFREMPFHEHASGRPARDLGGRALDHRAIAQADLELLGQHARRTPE